MGKIADSELEIMRVLWRAGRALTFGEIRNCLAGRVGWSRSTVQTLLGRLRDKGFVTAHSSYASLYSPNISEDEHLQSEGHNFIEKLFDGNAKNLVAGLIRSGRLDENDIDELKQFFTMEGGGES
ncbi:MAG: BlaI/MecI/CopY family transcriptional regulator [Defluviitaleaceae bacterium]|nr:BlaI/MecI/CopY family transcriptional regulator [Defluviitaleaceae bacterium]